MAEIDIQASRDRVVNSIRSIDDEFQLMDAAFDKTRSKRDLLVDKLMTAAMSIDVVEVGADGKGNVDDETDTRLRVVGAALKALVDVEKAAGAAIGLKLRRSEMDAAKAQQSKDRLAVVMMQTAPGRITDGIAISEQDLDAKLASMFDDSIKPFELKNDPRNIDEDSPL